MKKFLSICFLWAFSYALWGQNGSYGGDFNPDSPINPQEPSVTTKYEFKVTAGKGGYVNQYPSGGKFTKDTQIQLNANPNRGYTFKCWMEDDKVISTSQWYYYTMPGNDVEINAVFAFEPDAPSNPDVMPLDYKVTVEASPSRGGSVNCSHNEVKVGTYTYVSASPYNGYRFKGWMLDGKLVSKDTYHNFEMESRDMHFTALFEFDPDAPSNPNSNPNGNPTYLVSYTIDGEVCYTEFLPEGATITTLTTPIKKGHTFSGWDNNYTLMPNHDIIISGTFTTNKYHVTYNVDGVKVHEEDVAYDMAVTPPTIEPKEGHSIVWKNLPSKMPDTDYVVEGINTPNKYKLTYIVDGVVLKSMEVTYASPITAETEMTKEGHTFSGWSELPATMPANDVEVTGSFSVNTYMVTYTVDGAVHSTDSVAYGAELTALDAPVKEGHTFSGWSELPATMPANDVEVTGSFTINSYTLTYTLDGKEYNTATVVYGTELTALDSPVKEGHTFSGWSEIPATMPANDVEVTGSFYVNKYLVTFVIGDEVIASDSLEYGAVIVSPDAPVKEGYTFDGWGEVLATVPANDVIYEGCYTANIYRVYYYVGEDLVHTAEVTYGETIPEYIYDPIEEGYTFLGWIGEIYETMPAHDVTYTANIESGINQLINSNGQLMIYDLMGRKVTDTENLKGGIYIINGRKVMVK